MNSLSLSNPSPIIQSTTFNGEPLLCSISNNAPSQVVNYLVSIERENKEKKELSKFQTDPSQLYPDSITLRTLLISNMDKDVTRVKFMKILDQSKFQKNVDILIFKVNKEGLSTGEAKLMLVSKEKVDLAMRELPIEMFGKNTKMNTCTDFSDENEARLSKERQMEVKKIQRKFKKLFKFPKT